MYIPVLHARQSEKLAVLDLAAAIQSANQIRPLCIPVKDSKKGSGSGMAGLQKWIRALSKAKVPYYLLTTPYAHSIYSQKQVLAAVRTLDTNGMAFPFVAVTGPKPLSTIKDEVDELKGSDFGVLHVSDHQDPAKLEALLKGYGSKLKLHAFYDDCSTGYCDRWKPSTRALIRDGFVRQARNADYAEGVDEDFSDLPFKYKAKGFQAYGDHTICGEVFTPGGGEAYAVAIHLTFQWPLNGKSTAIKIRHFVSDDKMKGVPEADKYLQARAKLLKFYNANKAALSYSSACVEFEKVYTYHPKLGKVKQLTIRHHLELMNYLAL